MNYYASPFTRLEYAVREGPRDLHFKNSPGDFDTTQLWKAVLRSSHSQLHCASESPGVLYRRFCVTQFGMGLEILRVQKFPEGLTLLILRLHSEEQVVESLSLGACISTCLPPLWLC